MEYYTEIWSMAIDKAAKVRYNKSVKRKRYRCQKSVMENVSKQRYITFVKVAYTARDNDVVVASLHKGGQVLDTPVPSPKFMCQYCSGKQYCVSDKHFCRSSPSGSCSR